MTFSPIESNFPALPAKDQITTFNLKGWKPDTKIVLFGKEFQLHSVVLRLYSTFFRQALDDIDKESGGSSAGNRFRYDFEAVITSLGGESKKEDKKVELHFQKTVEKPRTPSPSPSLPPKTLFLPTEQEKGLPRDRSFIAFTNLLHAFYNKPYSLTSVASLTTLVHLATQIGSLPCVSSSLYITLWQSPRFVAEIREQPEKVLLSAFQLRHKLLFREALVHVVANWGGWHSVFEGEYRLICAVTKARNQILERIVEVNDVLFGLLSGTKMGVKKGVLENLQRGDAVIGSRRFYESILADVCGHGRGFGEELRALLKCCLVLELAVVGARCEGEFMCAEIEDGDLPWDLDEEDW